MWAPELYYRNDTFYVYYTVKRKSDGISCIGVATSKDPDQGFTDHGVVVEHGKEAIDAFIFDDNFGPHPSVQAPLPRPGAGQSVGITTAGAVVQIWEVRDGKRTELSRATLPDRGNVFLRLAVQNGFLCRFYWSLDGRQWKELKTGAVASFYDASRLPPWDRRARPGLVHRGPAETPARFAWFRLRYE